MWWDAGFKQGLHVIHVVLPEEEEFTNYYYYYNYYYYSGGLTHIMHMLTQEISECPIPGAPPRGIGKISGERPI